jgi:hypothetical protein
MMADQFDTLLSQSQHQPLVCSLSLHPPIVGQPFRLAQLRRALQAIKAHPGFGRVWLTRPGDIARHIASLPDGTLAMPPAL